MGAEWTVQTQQSEVLKGLPHSQGAKTSQWLMSRSAAQLSPSLFKRFPALVGEMRSGLGLGKRKVTGKDRRTNDRMGCGNSPDKNGDLQLGLPGSSWSMVELVRLAKTTSSQTPSQVL